MPEVPLSAVPEGKPCKKLRQERKRIHKLHEREHLKMVDRKQRKDNPDYEPNIKTAIHLEREHLDRSLGELKRKKDDRRRKAQDNLIAVRFKEVEQLDRFYPKEGGEDAAPE